MDRVVGGIGTAKSGPGAGLMVILWLWCVQGLGAEVRVNGEVWSRANTNDASRAHSLEELVAYASLGETIRK